MSLCLNVNQSPKSKERPDDEMNFAVYESAEQMLFSAYLLMSSFKDLIEPGTLSMYKPGHYGIYNAFSNRDSKSFREKSKKDKVVLLEFLPDFYLFSRRSGGIPAEDEMIRGIREMVSRDKLSNWLAFAAQIFPDIHHILREEISRGYYDLVKIAQYVENNIKPVMKFHENLRVETWPKSNDQVLLVILKRINDWVKTDVIEVTGQRLTRNSELQESSEPFRLLRNHPLYCGLLS